LVSDEWTVHTGELTPKLSLKRKVIEAKYQAIVEAIYGSTDATYTPPAH